MEKFTIGVPGFKRIFWIIAVLNSCVYSTLHIHSPPCSNCLIYFSFNTTTILTHRAVAALEILKGGAVDRVYCDYHDDFVVRLNDKDGIRYHFFQVKTKGKANHLWKLNETFGLKQSIRNQSKQDAKNIQDSFVGKLLLHTVLFEKYCGKVVFQTNIHCDDVVLDVLKDIHTGKLDHKFTKALIEKFNECFFEDLWCELSHDQIKGNLAKLYFEPDVQYLKSTNDTFESTVGECIYNYSEIDLMRDERKEIILKLMELVDRKTCDVIHEIDLKTIEERAGISIEDLLNVLSISEDAYKILSQGGDPNAVKSASIIQRLLKNGGAGNPQVEYASRCKTLWDEWYRANRHILPELDLNVITQEIRRQVADSMDHKEALVLFDLKPDILKLEENLENKKLLYDLNQDLLLGGIFAELVRGR